MISSLFVEFNYIHSLWPKIRIGRQKMVGGKSIMPWSLKRLSIIQERGRGTTKEVSYKVGVFLSYPIQSQIVLDNPGRENVSGREVGKSWWTVRTT